MLEMSQGERGAGDITDLAGLAVIRFRTHQWPLSRRRRLLPGRAPTTARVRWGRHGCRAEGYCGRA